MRFKFFTYNIDWAKTNSQETTSLRSIRDIADFVFVQEAKHLSVKTALGRAFYVHQALRNMAKQGVAIAWRHQPGIRRYNPNRRSGSGFWIGVRPLGFRMLTRYINYRILLINGHKVLLVSTHRPPQRYRRLWALFDRNLIKFIKSFNLPVIIGMDSNEHTHALFARMSGLVWFGIGIDGFWISRELVAHVVKGSLHKHPVADSDHHPVSLEFDF